MKVIIHLFQWIYSHAIGIFVSKETGEIATRAVFIAGTVGTIAIVYAAYAAAVSSLVLSIPNELSWSLTFIPDNTVGCLTIVTTLRVALFVAGLTQGFASIGVMK